MPKGAFPPRSAFFISFLFMEQFADTFENRAYQFKRQENQPNHEFYYVGENRHEYYEQNQ